jgi:GNAT superfamily N-acetyltransferase
VDAGEPSGRAGIRVATPADAAAIRSVQAQTWLATYPNAELGITREGLRHFLEGENGERIAGRVERTRQRIEAHVAAPAEGCDFVAVLGGEIVGFTAPFVEPGGHRRVGALYVRPSAQGSGLGHRLLARNLAWHGEDQDVYLLVAAYNERAVRFYARHGFVLTGQPGRDELAIDGVIMPELEMVRRGRPALYGSPNQWLGHSDGSRGRFALVDTAGTGRACGG